MLPNDNRRDDEEDDDCLDALDRVEIERMEDEGGPIPPPPPQRSNTED